MELLGTSTHVGAYHDLVRMTHEVGQLAWRTFRFLQPRYVAAETRLFGPIPRTNTNAMLDANRWALFGLAHRELADWHELIAMRYEWQATRANRKHCASELYPCRTASHRTLISSAAKHMEYARMLQPSSKTCLQHHKILNDLLKRFKWDIDEQRPDIISFTGADTEQRVWMTGDPDFVREWDDGSIEYLPRARIAAAGCREVFEARKLRKIFKDLTSESADVDWKVWQPPENMEPRCSTLKCAESPQQ